MSKNVTHKNLSTGRYQGKNCLSRAILGPAPPGNQVPVRLCKEGVFSARYEEETEGRHLINRATEQLRGLKSNNPANPMIKHQQTQHRGDQKKVRFKINIHKKFLDPLSRQAREGVRISHPADAAHIFNSKSEFNHPKIARIKITSVS